MDRAFGFYPNGWGFESLGGYQILVKTLRTTEVLEHCGATRRKIESGANRNDLAASLFLSPSFTSDSRE